MSNELINQLSILPKSRFYLYETSFTDSQIHYTPKPLRRLAPTCHECMNVFNSANSLLDLSSIILEVLSSLPDSIAIINTFWYSLKFGHLMRISEHNRSPNDLDIAIASKSTVKKVTYTCLATAIEQVSNRNNFPPYGQFLVSTAESIYPQIGTTIQVCRTTYWPNQKPVMLELHPLINDNLDQYLKLYAPFYLTNRGLSLHTITAKHIEHHPDHYYPFSDYSPKYEVMENTIKAIPRSSSRNIKLSSHTEPEERLATKIGPRLALAAAVYNQEVSSPIKIDNQSKEIVQGSIGLGAHNSISSKIKTVLEKAAELDKHLNCRNQISTALKDTEKYLTQLGY